MKSKKKGSRVENYGALLRYSRPSRLLRFHWPAGSFSFRRRFVFDCFSQWLGAGFHLVPLLSFCFWLVRIGFLFRLLVFHLFFFYTVDPVFIRSGLSRNVEETFDDFGKWVRWVFLFVIRPY